MPITHLSMSLHIVWPKVYRGLSLTLPVDVETIHASKNNIIERRLKIYSMTFLANA